MLMKIIETKIEKKDVLQDGIKVGVNTTINLIGENGAVVKSTTNFNPISVANEAKRYRTERQAKIDHLIFEAKVADQKMQAAGMQAGMEQLILTLFKHYKNEVDEYIQLGIDSFIEAVNKETDKTIKGLLGKEVPRADGQGLITIKDSIINRLNA